MLLHCSQVLSVCANSSGVCLSISVWKTSLHGIPRALESLWTYAPKETWEGAILGDLALIWLLGKSPAFVWKYSEWLLQSEWGLQVTVWIKWRGFFFSNAKNEVVSECHYKAGESEPECWAMAVALCYNVNSKVYCENHWSMLADQIYANISQWHICSWRPAPSPSFSNKTYFRFKAYFVFY